MIAMKLTHLQHGSTVNLLNQPELSMTNMVALCFHIHILVSACDMVPLCFTFHFKHYCMQACIVTPSAHMNVHVLNISDVCGTYILHCTFLAGSVHLV